MDMSNAHPAPPPLCLRFLDVAVTIEAFYHRLPRVARKVARSQARIAAHYGATWDEALDIGLNSGRAAAMAVR